MNAIVKIVAPAALALAAFSANASGSGLLELDYPLNPQPAVVAVSDAAPDAGWSAPSLDIHYPGNVATNASESALTRDAVRRELSETGTMLPFGSNA